MDNLIYLGNIALGLVGFLIALRIFSKKNGYKPFSCPLGARCDQVLYSKYAKFLGVPLEYLGMFYYSATVMSYTAFLVYPGLKNPAFVSAVFVLSAVGFSFSVYLTAIQAFKLGEWCSYCLSSAVVSSAIFVLALQTSVISGTLEWLAGAYEIQIFIIYILSASIGLNVAFMSEVLLFRFLSDFRISEGESFVLHTMRQITWFFLGVMAAASFVSIAPLSRMPVKTVILALLIVVSFIYDMFVSSKLTETFSDKTKQSQLRGKLLAKMPFVLAPISLILWLLILIVEFR